MDVKRLSPILLQPQVTTPRLLLTIGQEEGEEYIRQLNEFAAAWRRFLPHLTATVIPATNHFSMRAALDDPESDISASHPARNGREAPATVQLRGTEEDDMPISDDHRLVLWHEVLALCRVKAGENVGVLTGEGSLAQNVDLAMRACAAMGAKVCRIEVRRWRSEAASVAGQRGGDAAHGTSPRRGHVEAGGHGARSDGPPAFAEQLEILAAQTRMLMVIEPPEMLARMLPRPTTNGAYRQPESF